MSIVAYQPFLLTGNTNWIEINSTFNPYIVVSSEYSGYTDFKYQYLYGVYDQHAPIAGLSAVPIALWEFSLGIYLVVKGFKD
jgi:hypothetical protein